MVPWYYAVATFFLGGAAMLLVWVLCTASAWSSWAEEQRLLDRRSNVPGRWAYPDRRRQG